MFIYKYTNKVTGKVYIGKTTTSMSRRHYGHRSCSKNPKTVFHKSFKKYGESAFSWEIIDGANSETELSYKELFYIHKYNSLVPNGYNLKLDSKPHFITSKKQSTLMKNKLENYTNLKNMTKLAADKNGVKILAKNITTGEVLLLNSMRDASRLVGKSFTYIQNMLKGVKPYKVLSGYELEFENKETIKRKSKYNRK